MIIIVQIVISYNNTHTKQLVLLRLFFVLETTNQLCNRVGVNYMWM